MAYTQQLFKGNGVVYLNGVDVGNADVASLGITTSKTQVKNYRKPNGGNIYSNELIDAVEFSVSLYDWSDANLLVGLRASATANVSSAFSNVTKTGVVGKLITLDNIATITTITQDDVAPGTFVAAVEGTHYETALAGIIPLVACDFRFSGTYETSSTIEALTETAATYEIVIAMQNEFKAGEVRIVKLHKVSLSPIASMNMLGTEAAKLELKGEVLADTTKPGGKSQFFTISTKQGV